MSLKVKHDGTTLWRGSPIGKMACIGRGYEFVADRSRLGTIRLTSVSKLALRDFLTRKMVADEREAKTLGLPR